MFVVAIGMMVAGSAAAQKDCLPVFDALDKVIVTPTHIYTTFKKAGSDKPQTTETIYAKSIYTGEDGKWTRSEITLEAVGKQDQENRKKSKYTCSYVKDEPVNGEAAILYKSHAESPDDTSDAQIWISKRGLPLRGEVDTVPKGKTAKTHYSVRYDYKNVEPPKVD
jgi:hypothetical protein